MDFSKATLGAIMSFNSNLDVSAPRGNNKLEINESKQFRLSIGSASKKKKRIQLLY